MADAGQSVLRARSWYRQQAPFDLVMDQHHGIPWFAPWWSKTNCVAYVHEVLGPIWSAFYPWPVSMVGRWQERWIHWLYRKVPFWTGSESTKRALQRRGIPDVTVIPYGINLRPLAELEPKTIEIPVRLIAVSRLAPNKRIDHAIEATRVLNARGIAAQLTIVGGGEEEPRLKQQSIAGRARRERCVHRHAFGEGKRCTACDARICWSTPRCGKVGDSMSSKPTRWAHQRSYIPLMVWWTRSSPIKPESLTES